MHNGNHLVDGGPLRKIVFDLQCPLALTTGTNRTIDNLATGIEDDSYGDWDAIYCSLGQISGPLIFLELMIDRGPPTYAYGSDLMFRL